MEPSLTYEAAYKELEEITAAIEGENISVDLLSAKVKRASELISFCQSKLRATETEVDNIIQNIESSGRL